MTAEAFAALCQLTGRGDSQTREALRRVFVLGESGSAVARDLGLGVATVQNAMTAWRRAARLAAQATAGQTHDSA